MAYFTYYHSASQQETVELRGSLEKDTFPIRIQLCRCRQTNPNMIESIENVARGDLWVKFSNFKKQLSDNYDRNRSFETFITNKLSQLGVPKDEHLACVHTLFQAMEDVVNPEIPLLVSVFDATIIDREDSLVPTRLNWIPASRSFIQALVQVTLDSDVIARSPSCAVCLDDFEQQVPITQLPCTHYFHLDCVVRCLERNHMCPFCRYEMPMEQD
ncbi:hypothetical protein ACLB2K_053920 [Fragaria x ananassa]